MLGSSLLLLLAGQGLLGVQQDGKEETEEVFGGEDLTGYTRTGPGGSLLYRTLWRPRDCAGPAKEGDDLTVVLEYHGETKVTDLSI